MWLPMEGARTGFFLVRNEARNSCSNNLLRRCNTIVNYAIRKCIYWYSGLSCLQIIKLITPICLLELFAAAVLTKLQHTPRRKQIREKPWGIYTRPLKKRVRKKNNQPPSAIANNLNWKWVRSVYEQTLEMHEKRALRPSRLLLYDPVK